jgi:DNA-binding transcriptional ArsR family regulator
LQALHEVFESTARYFSVLGEPTRLKILHVICQGEKCVSDIIQATGLAQANVSRHLGLMYQAGMLSRRREGTLVHYRVADALLLELCRSVSAQVNQRLAQVSPLQAFESELAARGQSAQPTLLSQPSKETARV